MIVGFTTWLFDDRSFGRLLVSIGVTRRVSTRDHKSFCLYRENGSRTSDLSYPMPGMLDFRDSWSENKRHIPTTCLLSSAHHSMTYAAILESAFWFLHA